MNKGLTVLLKKMALTIWAVLIISFLWAMSLFVYSPVLGQCLGRDTMAFNDHMIVSCRYAGEYTSLDAPYKEKKWNGEYIGGRLAVIGLSAVLCAAADGVIHQALNGTGTLTAAQSLPVLAIGVAGLGLVFGGGAMVNHYRAKHKVTMVSSGNRIGMAYNFR